MSRPGPPYGSTSSLRLRGFEQGWGEALPEGLHLYAGAYSPLPGAHAASAFAAMDPRPEGVFVASDDLGIGFISGLGALGIEVHRDYELVGFDGQRRFMGMCPRGVASVVPPAPAMGLHAAHLLATRFQHPSWPARKVLLGCTIRGPSATDPASADKGANP
jgi:DNA-binding LacI/PurR family transcriptional regulator